MAAAPRFSFEDRVAGLRRSMAIYNAYGTTSVFEGHGIAGEVLAAYQDLRARGPLPVRSVLMFSPAWPGTDIDAVKELLLDWGRWLAGRGLGHSLTPGDALSLRVRPEDAHLLRHTGP